jgi:hypothetical protein
MTETDTPIAASVSKVSHVVLGPRAIRNVKTVGLVQQLSGLAQRVLDYVEERQDRRLAGLLGATACVRLERR